MPQPGAAQDREHQGQPQFKASDTSLGMGTGQSWAGRFRTGGPMCGRSFAGPIAGQSCGELEQDTASGWLEQGLTVLGAGMGSWATGSVGAGQGQAKLLVS